MRYIFFHTEWLVHNYNGALPLSHFLKAYFKKQPKLGSRDRKLISELIYSYYRTAHILKPVSIELSEQLQLAILLCSSQVKGIETLLAEPLKNLYGQPLEHIITYCNEHNIRLDFDHIWPKDIPFSDAINPKEWPISILKKPKLFIRVLPKWQAVVKAALNAEDISYEQIDDSTWSLNNNTTLERILKPQTYRIQDASSQKTATFFSSIQPNSSCWDCCSGAGGKSMLLAERNVRLTVSDIRDSILFNLKNRFELYGFQQPHRKVVSIADRAALKNTIGNLSFDHIIADVPCSGSGTWARTPEQLHFFKPEQIKGFAERQLQIATNVLPYLKTGGYFYYITCSAFRIENEDIVAQLLMKHKDLQLRSSELIDGSPIGADTMYIAVFYKK